MRYLPDGTWMQKADAHTIQNIGIPSELGICNSHIGDCCKGIYGRKTSGAGQDPYCVRLRQ